MSSDIQVYSAEKEIADFFSKTSATRAACDSRAQELVGGHSTPVAVQSACSYTVYAGPEHEFVVQFRLKSLELPAETATLARTIYGRFAPDFSYRGEIGHAGNEFNLARDEPPNSPEFCAWRQNLARDIARFFVLVWKSPQELSKTHRDTLRTQYQGELQLLLEALPGRFRPMIQHSIDQLPAIMTLPMVLLHKGFGTCNIMVDERSCNLLGVIDWAEAEIGPFGLNLYTLQALMSTLHLKNGRTRYVDYDALSEGFWTSFSRGAGVNAATIRVIKAAMILGPLLSKGSRTA